MYPSAFSPEERVLVCGGDLVTPVASGIAHPLIEAVKAAFSEERAGPGITRF